jgi:hypothetical protein
LGAIILAIDGLRETKNMKFSSSPNLTPQKEKRIIEAIEE